MPFQDNNALAWNLFNDSQFSAWKQAEKQAKQSIQAAQHSNTAATNIAYPHHNHSNYNNYSDCSDYSRYSECSNYAKYSEYKQAYRAHYQCPEYIPCSNYSKSSYRAIRSMPIPTEAVRDRTLIPRLGRPRDLSHLLDDIDSPFTATVSAASLGRDPGHVPGNCPVGGYCNLPATYSQFGYTHSNYIPCQPNIFNLAENQEIRTNFTLAVFAYDHNRDVGAGSQDVDSRTVKYNITIRKVNNLNGASSVGRLITLANGDTNEKYNVNLDTLDGDGYYQIAIMALNNPFNDGIVGINYNSPVTYRTIRIRKNAQASIESTSRSNTIDVAFGPTGVRKDWGYQPYEIYNASIPNSAKNCLFVTVTARDTDVGDTLRGEVGLRVGGVDRWLSGVIWSNGGNTIQSNGGAITGYAFIPLATIQSFGSDLHDLPVILNVFDGSGNYGVGCPAGCVHSNSACAGFIDVDFTRPTVGLTIPTAWAQQKTGNVYVADHSAAASIKVTDPSGKAVLDLGAVNNGNYSFPVTVNGQYKVDVMDRAGNWTTQYAAESTIDVTAPTWPVITGASQGQSTLVTIAHGTDGQSGINRSEYRVNNGAWTLYSAPFVVPKGTTIAARSIDNVGLISAVANKIFAPSIYYIGFGDITTIGNYAATSTSQLTNNVYPEESITGTWEITANAQLGNVISKPGAGGLVISAANARLSADTSKIVTSMDVVVPAELNANQELIAVGDMKFILTPTGFIMQNNNSTQLIHDYDMRGTYANLMLVMDLDESRNCELFINGVKVRDFNFVDGEKFDATGLPINIGRNTNGISLGKITVARIESVGNSSNIGVFVNPNYTQSVIAEGETHAESFNAQINRSGIYRFALLDNDSAQIDNTFNVPAILPTVPNTDFAVE